jgi:RsiW-degrading membrane proteinase PrsW (M82 family)
MEDATGQTIPAAAGTAAADALIAAGAGVAICIGWSSNTGFPIVSMVVGAGVTKANEQARKTEQQ